MKLFTFIFLCLGLTAQAGTYFVRYGASGLNNGSDWNNAWTNTEAINWPALNGGGLLLFAGSASNYDGFGIGANGVTNNPVIIRRASSTDTNSTGAAGWDASYDSPVTILGFSAAGYSNWQIDGVTNYGLTIFDPYTNGTPAINFAYYTDTNCTFTHLEVKGVADVNTPIDDGLQDGAGFYANNSSPFISNIQFLNCHIHNFPTWIQVGSFTGITISNCFFNDNYCANWSANHPTAMKFTRGSDVWLVACTFSNWEDEGIMLTPQANTSPVSNLNIWNCVFFSGSSGSGQASRILMSQYLTNGPVTFFNNTCVSNWVGVGTEIGGVWTNCASSNNIAWQSGSVTFGNGQDGANLYPASDAGLFVSDGSDFHLVAGSAAIAGATNLSAVFSNDRDGKARPASGAWDIGAYQYSTNSPAPPAATTAGFPRVGLMGIW